MVMGKVSKNRGGWRKGLTAITMGGTAEQEGCGQDRGNSNYQRELLKPRRLKQRNKRHACAVWKKASRSDWGSKGQKTEVAKIYQMPIDSLFVLHLPV